MSPSARLKSIKIIGLSATSLLRKKHLFIIFFAHNLIPVSFFCKESATAATTTVAATTARVAAATAATTATATTTTTTATVAAHHLGLLSASDKAQKKEKNQKQRQFVIFKSAWPLANNWGQFNKFSRACNLHLFKISR